MANDGFPTEKLGSLCSKVGSGATPRGGSKVYLDNGEIALIRSQNVYNDGFNREGLVYITAEHAEQLSNVTVESEDVLLNITGDSVARCCQVDPRVLPARVNQHVSIIRPKPDELIPQFLRYFLVSPTMQAQMLSWAHAGATRKALTKGMIESFKVPKPDLTIQQRIAHILGTLDDKIELNRRMNRTLEKMAAAVFKSWFIDFDPVRAKAEGRDPNLPKEIADLFPDSFEDSEIGLIPEGWTVVNLPDAIEVNPTRRIARGTPAPHVEMKAMPTKLSRPVGWPLRKFTSGSKFKNGDVLLARITPCLENGKTAFVDFLEEDQIGWGSTEYIVMCSQPPLPPEFTYLLARSERLREHAIANMTGTSGRQRVPASCFDKFHIAIPSEDVAKVFAEFVQPVFRKTRANDRQSARLAKLRDTLLPKLLSGELEVPDIGEPIEQPRVEVQTNTVIYTIGHSNHPIDKFIGLLKQHGITAVADVRSAPYSRFNPQFNKEDLAASLQKAGIAYVFLGKELGARPNDRSCYENGQADFVRMAERAEFKCGLDRVISGSEKYRVALMCAEKEPLDCHRTILVCRNLKTLGVNIKHILPDGSLEDHRETEGRLLRITRCERSIFDQDVSDSAMIERAYRRRAQDIAHKQNQEEAHHD